MRYCLFIGWYLLVKSTMASMLVACTRWSCVESSLASCRCIMIDQAASAYLSESSVPGVAGENESGEKRADEAMTAKTK